MYFRSSSGVCRYPSATNLSTMDMIPTAQWFWDATSLLRRCTQELTSLLASDPPWVKAIQEYKSLVVTPRPEKTWSRSPHSVRKQIRLDMIADPCKSWRLLEVGCEFSMPIAAGESGVLSKSQNGLDKSLNSDSSCVKLNSNAKLWVGGWWSEALSLMTVGVWELRVSSVVGDTCGQTTPTKSLNIFRSWGSRIASRQTSSSRKLSWFRMQHEAMYDKLQSEKMAFKESGLAPTKTLRKVKIATSYNCVEELKELKRVVRLGVV